MDAKEMMDIVVNTIDSGDTGRGETAEPVLSFDEKLNLAQQKLNEGIGLIVEAIRELKNNNDSSSSFFRTVAVPAKVVTEDMYSIKSDKE